MSFKSVPWVCSCVPRLVSDEFTGDWTAGGRVPSLWLCTKSCWVRLGYLRARVSYSCWPGMTDSWEYFSWTGRNCDYWREHWFDCELLPLGSVIMPLEPLDLWSILPCPRQTPGTRWLCCQAQFLLNHLTGQSYK